MIETAFRTERAVAVDTILFLCPEYDCRYPSETMWQRLDGLSRLGEVRVAPMLPSSHQSLEPPEGVRIERLGSRMRDKRDLFQYGRRIRELATRMAGAGRRGLIWANANRFTRRAALAARETTGWPLVFDVWDVPDLAMWTQYREGRYLKSFAHRLMGHGLAGALESADLVVWSLHPDSADRYFRCDPAKTLFLPNGFRWEQLREHPAREKSPGRRPGGPMRFLYMGHFWRSRGSGLLAEALEHIRRHVPAELHVVGDTGIDQARAAIQSLPDSLRPAIRFHGHMRWEEAMDLLGTCEVCLYPFPHVPELEYIYPLKLMEYAAMNKWILSSDLAGARRLLGGYNRVRFLDPDQPQDWGRTVLEIEAADEPAIDGGFACSDYDWEVLKQKLVDQVRRILPDSDVPGRSR